MRGRWHGGPDFFAQFPALLAWEAKIAALGHGAVEDMGAKDALAIAAESSTSTPPNVDPNDPQGLTAGLPVSVVPDGDSGDPPVAGTVHVADRERIAILRDDPHVGEVCIHFPRIGYRVTPA